MRDGKRVIAILTDPSFNAYIDFSVPQREIHNIFTMNGKDTIYVYGMCKRIDDEVIHKAKILGIPDQNLLKFSYTCKPNTRNESISREYLSIISLFSPDSITIFRDNQYSRVSSLLQESCKVKDIPFTSINSNGEKTIHFKNDFSKNIPKYYSGGRNK